MNSDIKDPLISTLTKKKNWFVGGLVVSWLVATVFAFWWFQFKNIKAFDKDAISNRTVFFESGELGNRLENLIEKESKTGKQPGSISVIHFWNPDCPCSRFNEVHVKKIISDYADKNVEFSVVVSGKTSQQRNAYSELAKQVFNFDAVKAIRSDWPMEQGPPSSPAVAIMNKQGKLVYFGPYSLGARCSPDKGKFVEKALDGLSDEKLPQKKQLNTLAVGCFCPWRSVV